MTLVHFPRMTIQPFDATGTPKGDPIIVQGDTNKGGTITAEISGLSSNALKVAASDIEYWISQEGVGEVSVDFTLIDIPAAAEATILGQKTVDSGITYVGNDTNPPYCGVLLEAENLQGDSAYLGFFRGKFAKDKETLNTQDPADKKAPEGDSYTFTAAGSPDSGDQKGEYVAKYVGSDAAAISTVKAQVLKANPKP
ncbi:phage tail protein [Lacticaseibacillus paracasei]|uniref:major tail protein n=1 Tax=Lacticaseibacillus paracasei TaxID=1597 RepID=UPI000EB645AA|nr:major tail protein [Lacticaseibacillus paracasei]AYG21676.1 phage tail protein [Lacticaseibacillus paracasei]